MQSRLCHGQLFFCEFFHSHPYNKQKGGGLTDNGASSYRRYLGGDDHALGELVSEYFDGLTLYLCTVVSDISTAEDAAEDTFFRLAVKKPHYNGKASFKTWLYTIARNIAYDRMRRAAKEVQLPDESMASTDAELLEKRYIRSEDRIALRKSLMKIKDDFRQALWLVYFEDMSVSDTATALGKSKHSTEMLLSRARAALKEQLVKDGFVYENL